MRLAGADPLCWHGATRARNATEYLLATGACLAAMPEYAFAFIVFHGADDTLCDVDGSRQLYERAKVPPGHCPHHVSRVPLLVSTGSVRSSSHGHLPCGHEACGQNVLFSRGGNNLLAVRA